MEDGEIGGRCRMLGGVTNVYKISFEGLDFILSSYLKQYTSNDWRFIYFLDRLYQRVIENCTPIRLRNIFYLISTVLRYSLFGEFSAETRISEGSWKPTLLEGCLTMHLPHEIIWNANLMQQGDFINVFLARHVSGTYAHHQELQTLSCSIWFSAPSFWMGGGLDSSVARHHPHRTHDVRSGSQDHHPPKNSVQKSICCNLTSDAPDDGRMYLKHVDELRIHQ